MALERTFFVAESHSCKQYQRDSEPIPHFGKGSKRETVKIPDTIINKAKDYIDIALVLDKFEGIRFNDRKKIRRYKFEVSADIEPLPYTPTDFSTNDPFVKKIIETGVRIV